MSLILPYLHQYKEAATGGVLLKKVFSKFHKIHRKTLVPESQALGLQLY